MHYVVVNYDHVMMFVSGSVLCEYGSGGTAGSEDGKEKGAKFNTPQGMAFYNEALYVADTNNHLLRKVGIFPMAPFVHIIYENFI